MKRNIHNAGRLAAAAFFAAAVIGCGDNEPAADAVPDLSVLTTRSDSISCLYGEQWGAQQNIIISALPEEKRQKIDKKAFMEGLRNVVMADVETPGVMDGIFHGASIAMTFDFYDAIGLHVDRNLFVDAFAGSLCGDSLTRETVAAAQADYDRLMTIVQQARMDKLRADRREHAMMVRSRRNANLDAAKTFVARLKESDSTVVETSSGLLYKIVKSGAGKKPTPGSTVFIIYQLATINGSIVDSSRGETVELKLSGDLIDGLKEGLLLIGEGAKAKFYIPSKLGFTKPADGIEPGQMIIVEVELVSVK